MLYGYMARQTFTCEANCPHAALRRDTKQKEPFRYGLFASQLLELYSATAEEKPSQTATQIAAGSYRSQRGSAGYKAKVKVYADALQEGIRTASPSVSAAIEGIRQYSSDVDQLSVALNGICQTGPRLSAIRRRQVKRGVSEYDVRCGLPTPQQALMTQYARGIGSVVVPQYIFSASSLERRVVNRLIKLPQLERTAETTLGAIESVERARKFYADPQAIDEGLSVLRASMDDTPLIELPNQA